MEIDDSLFNEIEKSVEGNLRDIFNRFRLTNQYITTIKGKQAQELLEKQAGFDK